MCFYLIRICESVRMLHLIAIYGLFSSSTRPIDVLALPYLITFQIFNIFLLNLKDVPNRLMLPTFSDPWNPKCTRND